MNAGAMLALVSAAALGLRHGFDYDHIAAITDITSVEPKPIRSVGLGMLYALGHAVTVALLGVAVIFGRSALPAHLDRVAERFIGCTLIVLGVYVCFSISSKQTHSPRSRIELVLGAFKWIAWRVSSLFGAKRNPPRAIAWSYNRKSAFLIGGIHGLGAETPTQLAVFLLAANLGGLGKGVLGLGMFVIGLLTMNAIMTVSAAGMYRASLFRPRFNLWISGITAAYSFCVGFIFLFGASNLLPSISGS